MQKKFSIACFAREQAAPAFCLATRISRRDPPTTDPVTLAGGAGPGGGGDQAEEWPVCGPGVGRPARRGAGPLGWSV